MSKIISDSSTLPLFQKWNESLHQTPSSKKRKKEKGGWRSITKGWFRNNRRPHRCVAAWKERNRGTRRRRNAGPEQMGVVEATRLSILCRSTDPEQAVLVCVRAPRRTFHFHFPLRACLYTIHTRDSPFLFLPSLCVYTRVYIRAFARVYGRGGMARVVERDGNASDEIRGTRVSTSNAGATRFAAV